MTSKRTPEAVYLAEGGVLVKHTHDVDLADRLAREAIIEHDYLGDRKEAEEFGVNLGDRRVIWCRIQGALPGSYAAGEGWSWTYDRCAGPARGVFPAVEYLR